MPAVRRPSSDPLLPPVGAGHGFFPPVAEPEASYIKGQIGSEHSQFFYGRE